MTYETITYSVAEGVGHLRLNRPDGANAVSEAFARDLRNVMIEIEFDDAVRAVSVTADGCSYCGLRFRIGEPVGRKRVPWYSGGRNPAVQLRVPFLGGPSGSFSTTYAGRF